MQTPPEPDAASRLVTRLGFAPHHEGGWYRETWRDAAEDGARSRGTAILYLLERQQRSSWHRVATKLWLHHGGGALRLLTIEDGRLIERRIWPDLLVGDLAQAVVRPGDWQAA